MVGPFKVTEGVIRCEMYCVERFLRKLELCHRGITVLLNDDLREQFVNCKSLFVQQVYKCVGIWMSSSVVCLLFNIFNSLIPKMCFSILPCRGVARIFKREFTLRQIQGTHQIVMLTSTLCFTNMIRKGFQRGGHRSFPPPLAMPFKGGLRPSVFSCTHKLTVWNRLQESNLSFCRGGAGCIEKV